MHFSPALAPGGPGIQMTGALQAGSCLEKYCIIIWEVFRLHGIKLTGPGSRGKPYESCAVLALVSTDKRTHFSKCRKWVLSVVESN